jgi:hypothetical protein
MPADLEEPCRTWVGVFSPEECPVLRPLALFATPQANISAGDPLACNIFLPLSDNTEATSTCEVFLALQEHRGGETLFFSKKLFLIKKSPRRRFPLLLSFSRLLLLLHRRRVL